MNNRIRAWSAGALLLSQSLVALPVLAASFPDVPATHIYREQIETLADRSVVKGNPDGTFKPEKTVNRAEMLTMLYRAKEKNPSTPSKACFKDVGTDAWFSAVICDAASKGYVGGYPDGFFRPEKEVNRVEALKMIHTVFGLDVDHRLSTDVLKQFTDVSLTAWYVPYMTNAFEGKILPIAGQTGSKFRPDAFLLRGEAAAYIFNALGLTLKGSSSSSSQATRSSRSSSADVSSVPVTQVDFPFGDDGTFNGKNGKVYRFSLKNSVTLSIDASVNPDEGEVQCRLYKIDSDTSFALEYYIGHVINNHCSMRVSLSRGDYQLELTPKKFDAHFTLTSKTVSGDDNDGFREAIMLTKGAPKTGYLEVEDYAEWYYFKLATEEKLMVEVTGTDSLRCLIYPMGDVDLYGFSGPVCNEEYLLPVGTYYIGVMRRDEKQGKESFTIRYK